MNNGHARSGLRVVPILVPLLLAGLLATACGGDGSARGETPSPEPTATTLGFEMPDPVESTIPTMLRTLQGPPSAPLSVNTDPAWWTTYKIAALGLDEVVVGAFDGPRVGAWFVGSLADGSWAEIAPPPVEGEIRAWLLDVGHDAVLVGAPCPGKLPLPEDDSKGPECKEGSDGLGVWRLDHRTREWSEVALVPTTELAIGDPLERWYVIPVGARSDAVYVDIAAEVDQTVYRVDMAGNLDAVAEWSMADERDEIIHPRCLTGSGVLVGEVRTSGQTGWDDELAGPGSSYLTVRSPADAKWRHLEDATFTHQQTVGCGAETVSIVGEIDASLDVGEWRVVDLDGNTVRTQPLPAEVLLGDSARYIVASFFVGYNTHRAGEGTGGLAIVRDFGDIVNPVVMSGPGLPVDVEELDHPRQVIVLPGPGAPPLLHDFSADRVVIVDGATRMPDGRVVALVRRTTERGAGDDEFELLLAE